MVKRALTAAVLFGVLFAVVLSTLHAAPNGQTQTPVKPFDFLILILSDAEEKGLLTEEIKSLLAAWLIENLLVPATRETPDRIRERLLIRELSSFRFLIYVLSDARDRGVFPDEISELLSDLLTDDMIAPHTGETSEQIVERLSAWPARNVILLLPPNDRAALVELYNATDGPNWTDNGNWLSDGPLAEWYGVVVDDTGRVKELRLESNQLVGEIPPSLGRLASLEALTLWGNRLSGPIPPELSNLTELRVLDLWSNQLDGPIPPQLGSLTKLVELFLGRNRLSGSIPPELRNLSNLSRLNLKGNGLSGCLPEEFHELREIVIDPSVSLCTGRGTLVALYEAADGPNWTDSENWLSDKLLDQWHGVAIDHNGQVIGLDLVDNRLKGTIPPGLGGLPNLRVLFLNGNRLSGQLPSELGDLSNLSRLFIGGNRFVGCIPDRLEEVPDSDLSTLNLAFCDSGPLVQQPSTDASVFSHSPTRISLTWSCGLAAVSPYKIYRNGALIASLPTGSCSYTDEGLDPNVRYEYRIEFHLADGPVEADSAAIATLTYPPTTYLPRNVTESGFELAIVDNLNPSTTEYRVEFPATPSATATPPPGPPVIGIRAAEHSQNVSPRNSDATLPYPITLRAQTYEDAQVVKSSNSDLPNQILSDWSASRCRTFDDLQDSPGDLEVISRNMDGIETKGQSRFQDVRQFFLQERTGNDDPWVRNRIADASTLYGLTERAGRWMLSDIPVLGYRNEPGYAGYDGVPSYNDHYGVGIGYPVGPGTLMHEMMHGFWEHWDGFPQPCDAMNLYAFRRDVARFMLDFRKYDQDGQQNPWEEWRPFYNDLATPLQEYDLLAGIGFFPGYYDRDGERVRFWKLLELGEYDELWGLLFHLVDTEIPSRVAGKISLIPPSLRPYFEGFIADSEDTTWRDELLWYTSLPSQERRLWDTAYSYHNVLAHSPEYTAPQDSPITRIPSGTRELLRNADRRVLVDFINTLEDISCNTQSPCKEVWNTDFGFWTRYVEENLRRSRLYREELSPSIGIELDRSNLDAVKEALRILVADVSDCGRTEASLIQGYINSLLGLSDLQRNAFLAMIEVREWNGSWDISLLDLTCGRASG